MNPIEANNLTKVYKLYDRPSSRLKELFLRRDFHKKLTVLDNVSFSVRKGETLGIIGENGAGKSTLLKILAKTLSPTGGSFEVNGRISSLLELGSGFHPEFTGLDNIFFYGSLRGIDRAEMDRKVEEIIAFSELGNFINYPVKTYSSGMFVRLAFSVATAVDPDVLIIDEVLSVGDLHFQKKSTDRILSFREGGKTIAFCSHELFHVARICDRVIWLKNGKIHREGEPLEVIQEYETYQLAKTERPSETPTGSGGNGVASFQEPSPAPVASSDVPLVFIRKVQTFPAGEMKSREDLYVKVQCVAADDRTPYRVAVRIRTVDFVDIIGVGTVKMEPFYGNKTVSLVFPKLQLRAGTFIAEAFAFDQEGVYWYDRKEAPPLKIPRETIEFGLVDLPHRWMVD